jgi:hypothetical protein
MKPSRYQRPSPARIRKPVVLLATEGEKTEAIYFEMLRHRCREVVTVLIWRRKFFSVKVAGGFSEGGRVCGFRFLGLGEGEVGFANFPGFGDFGEDARDESQE